MIKLLRLRPQKSRFQYSSMLKLLKARALKLIYLSKPTSFTPTALKTNGPYSYNVYSFIYCNEQ